MPLKLHSARNLKLFFLSLPDTPSCACESEALGPGTMMLSEPSSNRERTSFPPVRINARLSARSVIKPNDQGRDATSNVSLSLRI